MSQLFASGGQSVEASASALQDRHGGDASLRSGLWEALARTGFGSQELVEGRNF